ncbi:MAG: hypothetical protein JO331_00300 [Verrucomicrobia bacterium]|nr:hypothetical protein [Verrucomicrobiota bacterium]
MLRRLSVFVGAFVLESAIAVVSDGEQSRASIAADISNLVAKSLVSVETSGQSVQYRLLDSMRAYARRKLEQTGEVAASSARHAHYHWAMFRRAEAEWENRAPDDWLSDYGRCIGDVRAALDWAFSAAGDADLGAALTAVSVPLWIHLGLIDECRRNMDRALVASWDRASDRGRTEMKLLNALAGALLQTHGPAARGQEASQEAAEIAKRLGEKSDQIRALWALCDYHTWRGEHHAALSLTDQIREIAIETRDRAAQVNVGRQVAAALRYLGHFAEAREELERMIGDYVEPVHWTRSARFQLDPRMAARGTLANVLWFQGFADQAICLSRQALEEARTTKQSLALCSVLAHTAIPIALYANDCRGAECWLAELLEHTTEHLMPAWEAVGRCLQGILLIQLGKPEGLTFLRSALDEFVESGFRMRYPAYLGSLASGLCHFGRLPEARAAIDEALDWTDLHGERWCFGELLRIKGDLLCADTARSELNDAETCFQKSIEWSRRQGARFFELRAAESLTRLWRIHNGCGETEQLLSGTYGRFIASFNTTGLSCTPQEQERLPAVVA